MNASVLTKKQQKKSLSRLKNRKKSQKNILAAPDIVKIGKPVFNETYISKIIGTLEELLPNARLPVPEKSKATDTLESTNKTSEEPYLKRRQLFLGINSVSRGVSNETVACILFADDVKPKLLISHLIVLCSLRNIPYLYMENLRELTKRTLGFSCIAVGFKKNSSFFSPVIKLFNLAVGLDDIISTTETSINNTAIILTEDCEEKSKTEKKVPFTYLYRTSNVKREFVPDSNDTNFENSDSMSFIPVKVEDEVKSGKSFSFNKGMVRNKVSNKIGNKKQNNIPVEYSSTKIIKMEANPNREKDKFSRGKRKKH